MENQHPRIRLELTDEQRKQIKETSGKDVASLEFTAQELEERIAPSSFHYDLLGNKGA